MDLFWTDEVITIIMIIIKIITLFQADNIFGTNASLTYGPQIQRHTCVWWLQNNENYLQFTELVRFPYIEHAASGLPNPTLLEGGGTIYPGSRPAGFTTRSPRMVTECLLTRSVLVKMKFTTSWFHGMCLYMYIVFTVSPFHADAHSVYLVFQTA